MPGNSVLFILMWLLAESIKNKDIPSIVSCFNLCNPNARFNVGILEGNEKQLQPKAAT